MEKLLVAQALDQRDFLKKKINDAINSMEYVLVCKEKDTKIKGSSVEDIEERIKSDWQSVNDMIDRYNRIKKAIVLSNATTTIKFTDGTEMTKAEAIALKNSERGVSGDAFEYNLIMAAKTAFNKSIRLEDQINHNYELSREDFIKTQLQGSDKKTLDDASLEAIDKAIAPFAAKWINPLDIDKKIKELEDKHSMFKNEVDTLLKISNATTYVEF